MKKLIAVVFGTVVATAMADITLDGPTLITSTTTVSEKVTGPGYYVVANGATLTLSGVGNDFTGGVIISNGVLKAQSDGAFGTGPVVYEGTAAQRTVQLDVVKGAFTNDFVIKDAGTSADNPAIYLTKSATINGDIMLDQGIPNVASAYIALKIGASSSDTDVKLTANGTVLAGDGRINVRGWGDVVFMKKVTAGSTGGLFLGNLASERGSVALYSPENAIGRISQYQFDVKCHADNVISNSTYRFCFNTSWGNQGYCTIYLNGHDQNFTILDTASNCDVDFSENEKVGESFRNTYQAASTITFDAAGRDSASAVCCNRFSGNVNLVMENKMTSGNVYKQGFQGRDNSGMTGSIHIKDGCNFRVLNGCRFGGVTNLTVESGGYITYEAKNGKTTPVGRTFTGLETLTLKGAAYIRTESAGTVEPINSPKAKLFMDADSRIYLKPNVVMTVKKLFIDGKQMPAGEYTSENLPQMDNPTASYNGGVLKVLKGPEGIVLVVR